MTSSNGRQGGGRDEGDDGAASPYQACTGDGVQPSDEVIELGNLVLEAYVQHRIELARKVWEREQLLALFNAAEPIWDHLQRTCRDRSWTERRDAVAAAREAFRQQVLADRTRESA